MPIIETILTEAEATAIAGALRDKFPKIDFRAELVYRDQDYGWGIATPAPLAAGVRICVGFFLDGWETRKRFDRRQAEERVSRRTASIGAEMRCVTTMNQALARAREQGR
jgi:hypothetical protein